MKSWLDTTVHKLVHTSFQCSWLPYLDDGVYVTCFLCTSLGVGVIPTVLEVMESPSAPCVEISLWRGVFLTPDTSCGIKTIHLSGNGQGLSVLSSDIRVHVLWDSFIPVII